MKVLTDSNDIVSALTIDTLLKSIMIKVDDILQNNTKVINKAVES